jgi:hypothetical protein
MRGSEVLREVQPLPQAARANDPERFVDSAVAAKFLSIQRRQLLQLPREGKLPAYPIGDGQRRLWRFRLSDLAKIAGASRVMGLHRQIQIGRPLRLAIYRQLGCSFCRVPLKQACVGSGQCHPNSMPFSQQHGRGIH